MLDFRLQLLKDSGQIGAATEAQVKALILYLEERTGIALNEENAAMLVTHFSIALERGSRNEEVGAMEDLTRVQVRESPHYLRATSLLDDWLSDEALALPALSHNERDFLLLHLCVLLGSGNSSNDD